MSQVVVSIPHLTTHLRWNISSNHRGDVALTTCKIVSPEVQLVEDLLPRHHFLFTRFTGRWHPLRNTFIIICMITFSWRKIFTIVRLRMRIRWSRDVLLVVRS